MLSGFAVAWLVANDWDCLMSLWKNHALFLLFGSINLVFSLMLYLGWLGACLQHGWLIQSRHKTLWSFSFWLLMPFYASLNYVLSLCMIMAVIALLVGRSQYSASPHFVLSMSSTRASNFKNQVIPMCPPYIPISNLLFRSIFDFLLSILQIKLFLMLCGNWSVNLSRTWWHTLLFSFLKIWHCGSLMLSYYACKL
jgi:hypothetical protein